MKKTLTILFALILSATFMNAQVTLAKWTFPTGNPGDSIADGGIAVNLDKAIHTEGGTSAIDFSKNGASSKAAQATGWDGGNMLKCWVVKLSTHNYGNLKLSSKMQSGGNNPGPKDFKVQYKISETGTWTDAPGTTIVTANDWSTGALDSVALPGECGDKPLVFLRWIMTSDVNSQGGSISSSGINKIDDIYITGTLNPTGVKEPATGLNIQITPNPSHGIFSIESPENISSIMIYNAGGKNVYRQMSVNVREITLKLDSLSGGTYFLNVKTISGKEGTRKLVIM